MNARHFLCVFVCCFFYFVVHTQLVSKVISYVCVCSLYWVLGFHAMTLLYIYSSSTRLICIFPFHIHHLNEMRCFLFARFTNQSYKPILCYICGEFSTNLDSYICIQHLLYAAKYSSQMYSFSFLAKCVRRKTFWAVTLYPFLDSMIQKKESTLFEKIDKDSSLHHRHHTKRLDVYHT